MLIYLFGTITHPSPFLSFLEIIFSLLKDLKYIWALLKLVSSNHWGFHNFLKLPLRLLLLLQSKLDKLRPTCCGLYRILLVECNPHVCPAGEKCRNQMFEKRLYPPLMPYHTQGRGWGLKTLVPLKKGTVQPVPATLTSRVWFVNLL